MLRWVISVIIAIVSLVALPVIIGSVQSFGEWLGRKKYLKTIIKIVNASISIMLLCVIVAGLSWFVHSVIFGSK